MKFVTILGARPQFIKAAPLSLVLRKANREVLIHTGQHYDYQMSDIFFKDLALPAPDYHLGIGSGLHGAQTGAIMAAVEKILLREKPDAVIVYGDTNSTVAGALAAAKLHIPIAHVEAGLRSFNRRMPEEINRLLTDHVSTWLFVPSDLARRNLKTEGIRQRVFNVGDIMLDALRLFMPAANKSIVLKKFGLTPKKYYLATVHRAENTGDSKKLKGISKALENLDKPVILPLHPRTQKKMKDLHISFKRNVRVVPPQGYLDMIRLEKEASCILTDSGGIQKEAFYLKVPCLTLREETEWPETIQAGWNRLSGTEPKQIAAGIRKLMLSKKMRTSLYGNGFAAQKIANILSRA